MLVWAKFIYCTFMPFTIFHYISLYLLHFIIFSYSFTKIAVKRELNPEPRFFFFSLHVFFEWFMRRALVQNDRDPTENYYLALRNSWYDCDYFKKAHDLLNTVRSTDLRFENGDSYDGVVEYAAKPLSPRTTHTLILRTVGHFAL